MSQKTIKICGFTGYDDAKAALDLGIDFLGFIFAPKSKRNLVIHNSLWSWLEKLYHQTQNTDTQMVAVTAGIQPDTIRTVLNTGFFSVLQISLSDIEGSEKFFDQLSQLRLDNVAGLQVWLAVRLDSSHHLIGLKNNIQCLPIQGFVLDSLQKDGYGGTGQVWQPDSASIEHLRALKDCFPGHKFILAGGLTPDNVVGICQSWQRLWTKTSAKQKGINPVECPFDGIDLAGGVEIPKTSPPGKDISKMRQLSTNFRHK